MDTQWGDYCNGFTYEILYVSGPFEDMEHPSGDPSLFGPDLDLYFGIVDPGDGSAVKVNSQVPDLTWLGTHTFKVRGTNGVSSIKLFESIDSDVFYITWIDPCLTTTVIDRPI